MLDMKSPTLTAAFPGSLPNAHTAPVASVCAPARSPDPQPGIAPAARRPKSNELLLHPADQVGLDR
jgi:hypothetical protein